jgi:hypothetical protein
MLPAPADRDPDARLDASTVRAAIGELGAGRQLVARLTLVEGGTCEAVGQVLGVTHQAIALQRR